MPRAKSEKMKRAEAAERVRKHRAKLRAAGLRPIQIWVPDTRRPGFAEEIQRQCKMLANDPHEEEWLEWLEKAAGEIEGWV